MDIDIEKLKASAEDHIPLGDYEKSASSDDKVNSKKQKKYYRDKDIECGFWIMKGEFMQKFASKKVYILLFGIVGSIFQATQSYFYGTISTVEKSVQISSRNLGIITSGGDIAFVLGSVFVTYLAAKGHRPKWIALGILSMSLACFMNALPHFLYGPTKESLAYVELDEMSEHAPRKTNSLCKIDRKPQDCDAGLSNFMPQAILFCGSFLSGLGMALYFSLGLTYMDDNVRKDKVPMVHSLTAFFRRLGPLLGFALASLCLKYFVLLDLDPKIEHSDPRWLGAWWVGWLAIGSLLLVLSPLFASFPKMLPNAAERQKLRRQTEKPVSFVDFKESAKRILTNKTFIFNNLAGIFYLFGYTPFLLFQAKYIEIQYRLSPSQANMATGSASMVFSALGLLTAGTVITKLKPSARQLAAWNIVSSALSVLGIMAYAYFGCEALNNSVVMTNSQLQTCNNNCNCEFVKYSPVCGDNGKTYISPCHAGCKDERKLEDGTLIFTECSCINSPTNQTYITGNPAFYDNFPNGTLGGTAKAGVCPVNCWQPFYLFMIIVCFNKFIGGTESAANFLIALRCVEERDKSLSLGILMAVQTLFSFLPAPIIFGILIDRTCILWGATCSKKGNCWLYDGELLRYLMNYTAAGLVLVGTFFDIGTWYYSKNFTIFDKKEEKESEENAKELIVLNSKEQEAEK